MVGNSPTMGGLPTTGWKPNHWLESQPRCGWNSDQGWVYRIEKLSNADISRLSEYRRVYRIEPPISSTIDTEKLWFILSFFAKICRKFQKSPENSKNWPKIRRKFLKRSFLRPKYGINIVSYQTKKTNFVSNEKKRYRSRVVMFVMFVMFVTVITFVTLGIHHHTWNAWVIRIPKI